MQQVVFAEPLQALGQLLHVDLGLVGLLPLLARTSSLAGSGAGSVTVGHGSIANGAAFPQSLEQLGLGVPECEGVGSLVTFDLEVQVVVDRRDVPQLSLVKMFTWRSSIGRCCFECSFGGNEDHVMQCREYVDSVAANV